QRLAVEELHGDVELAALLAGVEDLADVRVVQVGPDLGLAEQPPDVEGVGEEGARQHLDGDAAVEVDVASTVDQSHRAAAHGGEDFVPAEGTRELNIAAERTRDVHGFVRLDR